MKCLYSGTAILSHSPYHSPPRVVSHFTWQQPFGKKMLLIWLDNLFSHINSGPTRANEKCVINVRRLNASRMCSSSSASASAPRRGPDNYYPAALKDMRAQISDTYLLIYILYIHIYISRVLYIIINTATHGFNCFSVEDLRRIVGHFVLFCGCHLTKVLNLSGLGRDT